MTSIRLIRTSLSLTILAIALSSSAQASQIAGLFTTGVDNAGNALAGGVVDPHYAYVSGFVGLTDAYTITSVPGSWVANDSTSTWIWENASGQPTFVERVFRTTFDLTGFDPSTASITGLWAATVGVEIYINGTATGQTTSGSSSYTSFSITSGFVAGVNQIYFKVSSSGESGGLRVGRIEGTATPSVAAVPEPAGLTLAAIGLLGTLMGIRSRRQAS